MIDLEKESKKKNYLIRTGLIVFVSMLIVFILILGAEYISSNNIMQPIELIINLPKIFMVDYVVILLLFVVIYFLTKQVYLATIIEGTFLYMLACMDFFKYREIKDHFAYIDLLQIKNANSVVKFIKISFTSCMITMLLSIIILVILLYKFRRYFTIKLKYKTCLITSAIIILIIIYFIANTNISYKIYKWAEFDMTQPASPITNTNKYNKNKFIGFNIEYISNCIKYSLKKPAGYSKNLLDNIMVSNRESNTTEYVKPDVIFVLSEAFYDMRKVKELNIPNEIYKNYDKMVSEGVKGQCMVPVTGGGTSLSEFELLVGLPARSINNNTMYQSMYKKDVKRPTLATYFKMLGYNTISIHPFERTFYYRGEAYPNMGFDNIIFDDNMNVKLETSGPYLSDKTFYNQVIESLNTNKNAKNFIFGISMQNHGPYEHRDKSYSSYDINHKLLIEHNADMLNIYIQGIKYSDDALGEFLKKIKESNKPTVVVLVGDHFPNNTVYGDMLDKIGYVNDYGVFKQDYVIWSNYNMDFTKVTKDRVSLFYLQYILLDSLNLPDTKFTRFMKDMKEKLPIYSLDIKRVGDNIYKNFADKFSKYLDMVTYDRVKGDMYSNSKIYYGHLENPSNHVGEITKDITVIQTLNLDRDTDSIQLLMANFMRNNHGNIKFEIFNQENELVFIKLEDMENIRDNEYYPIYPSKTLKAGRYKMKISSTDGYRDNAVTIYYNEKDIYIEGQLYINGELKKGDLIFRLQG